MNELNPAESGKQLLPERPEWVEKIIEEGNCMDIRAVVPLDVESLLASAMANTGLEDFGEESWYEPFKVYMKSADEEGDLHLLGRLRLRSEVLHFLEARLRIEDTYKKHPEIDDEQIEAPLIIIGQGRSGTSGLQQILSADPDNGVVKTWEAMFPCPPPRRENYLTDPRIEKAHKLISQWNRVTPNLTSMHNFIGEIPTECVHIFSLCFYPNWINCLSPVPGYDQYFAGKSMIPAFRYHKRVLKLLQWKNPRKRWLLKTPSHLDWLDQLVEVYPDAKFIWPHRDPSKSLGSGASLIGTLLWGRSNDPFKGGSYDWLTKPEPAAARLNRAIDWIEGGLLKKNQLANIGYLDFVNNPMAAVRSVYEQLELSVVESSMIAIENYIKNNPRSERPEHRYAEASEEQLQYERQLFSRYTNYFNVTKEL